MAWTKDQEKAIYKSGQNIIVSAGAGSGKTAVLSERILEKVKSGVSVDSLLVLTLKLNEKCLSEHYHLIIIP